jgi:hypothetical protein
MAAAKAAAGLTGEQRRELESVLLQLLSLVTWFTYLMLYETVMASATAAAGLTGEQQLKLRGCFITCTVTSKQHVGW